MVLPNSLGGLKPGGITWDEDAQGNDSIKRPSPLTVRLSERQRQLIRGKAKAAGMSVNGFVLASALGSDYRPPMNPELTRVLLALNRELTAQGNNLNQIARQLNAGIVLPGQESILGALAQSIQQTLRGVRAALARGGPVIGG